MLLNRKLFYYLLLLIHLHDQIYGFPDHIEYKTTYACDGNILGLSCRPGESIYLVRANYGRFSLSICNDGGKLDLRVNCMSFRSYLIMLDRCSGKSKCNATVSSDLFGDPCPGTPKYLEVQYHCVQNLTTTTRRPPTDTALTVVPQILIPSTKSIDREIGSPSSSSTTTTTVTTTTRRSPTDIALPVDPWVLRPSSKPIDREIGSSSTASSLPSSSNSQDFTKPTYLANNRVEDLLRPGIASSPPSADDVDDERLSKLQSYAQSQSLIINSMVVGTTIHHDILLPSSTSNLATHSSPSHHHTPLTQPIIIFFRHLQEDDVSSPKCVYWSRETSDWLDDGCSVAATNLTHTVCQCNHLSSFALLMEVALPSSPSSSSSSSTIDLGDENAPINWLRIVVIISSGISALFLLFILMILYTIHGDNREVLFIHKDLCLTLLIVQITFFIGIFQTEDLLPCILSAGILHYFLLSSFLWTFLEAFDHFLNLIDVFETLKTTHRLWWYYFLAFGGPGLVTLLSLFINPHSYGSVNYCWLRLDLTLWLTLVGPCTLSLIASLVFICISAFIVCHNSAISTALKGKELLKVEDIRCGLKWIIFLLFFQCTNWITCYAYLTNQSSIPLGLTFACSNFLLGFYCIIFCIIRTDSVQHHKIAQHLPLMDWCFDGSETETSTKESVFSGSTHNGLTHHHHHHTSSLYGPSPVIPVVTHVTTQVSPYSDGTIRTFKTSHIINNTLALYESIESPPPPLTSTSTSSANNSGNNTLNNLQQSNNHLHHLVNNIIPTAPPVSSSSSSTVGTLLGNTNGTTTFVSMSSSSSSSSTGGVGQTKQQQQNQHNYHQIQQQQQQQSQNQLAHHQLISSQHHHNNMSLGIYGQSTLSGTKNLNLNNQQMIIGEGTNHRNHSSLMLNNSLGLYESIEPPSPASSPTPYHHTSRNQIYLGHGSLSQHHHNHHHQQQQQQRQQHLIGTSGRKHRMLIPSDFPV